MKQQIKTPLIVLFTIAFCVTSCIILAKVYFTCILGIGSFFTTKSQTTVPDSIATNVRSIEKQKLSEQEYITSLSH